MPEYSLHEIEAMRLQREYQHFTDRETTANEQYQCERIANERRPRHYKKGATARKSAAREKTQPASEP